jgi:hypothetical protein
MDRQSKRILFALVVVGVVGAGCLILAVLGAALGWGTVGPLNPRLWGDRFGSMCPWCTGADYQTPWRSAAGFGGMLIVLALLASFIVLLIVGAVWLARSKRSAPSQRGESPTCPSC